MKYGLLSLFVLTYFASCTASKPKEGSVESVLAKLDSINSWYTRLVVKQYRPIYVFETEAYNKNDSEIRGNLYDYFLVEDGSVDAKFDYEFVKQNFEYAKSYINKKHLSYSKIYLQIPIKREGYTKDIVGAIGRQQRVVGKLTREVFFFDNSIASLVDSKRYNPNFSLSELPKDLIKLIKNRFETVKSFLPENYKSKIIKSKLIVDDPSIEFSPQKLFLNNRDGNVHISSLLVRAILVKAISREASIVLDYAGSDFKLERPVQLLNIPQLQGRNQELIDQMNSLFPSNNESWETSRQRFARFKKPEIEYAYRDILTTINSTLDFLILHEFSHIYLGPNEINEYRCDCYAFKSLKNQSPQINYGVFNDLMVTAIENQGGQYWYNQVDSARIQEVINRYKRVKKIDSLVTINVMTIDFQCDKLNF